VAALKRVRAWLDAAPGRDEVERRQAALLQGILIALIVVIAGTVVVGMVVQGPANLARAVLALAILEPLFIIPLLLLRRGQFQIAAAATVIVIEFVVVAGVWASGPAPGTGVAFAIPMTIAALVVRRPGLVIVTVISIGTVVLHEALGRPGALNTMTTVNFSISLVLLGLVLDRFGVSLRDSFAGELRQRHQLEAAQEALTVQSAETARTYENLKREIAERAIAEDARRAIEAKVLEVQKLESLGVLAGGIAHDFNNLLVAIMGNASLALMDLPADSPVRQSITDIEVASQRAGELARQMLAYSGRSKFVIEAVELSELVRELLALLQVSIGKGVILKLHLPDEPIVVDADAAQLRQVVMNLVINAADAIGDRSGTITITVGRLKADTDYLSDVHPEAGLEPGDYASLQVSDTGVGMDGATQARIFDPFFTTKFAGRGLGLAAVLGIVRGHGGALRVYPELGHGSTFRIVLPLSAASPPVAPDPDEIWRGHGTVLVVDDEPMVRTVARRLLESLGMAVVEATGGEDAIERFTEEPDEFDAILLDLTMPDVGGTEVFRRVRALRPDARVVLMSGYHEDEASSTFGEGGLAGFVQKPFTATDLAKRMRVALDGSDTRPEARSAESTARREP
jgi:signal transduction histidine kinase/CheY-like chemotaxis protein